MYLSHLAEIPDSSKALVGLANIFAKQHDDDNAIHYYEEAVKCDNRNHFAFYRLGVLYDKKKDYLKATQHLQSAIALDPNNIKYNQQLGFIYETMGSHADAIPFFKRIMEIEDER